MPRPQRKEINFTKDSILSLMQEIYNELVEQRQTAIRIQNKMLSMLKDPEDMTTIGPLIEKQQKIVSTGGSSTTSHCESSSINTVYSHRIWANSI